MSDNPYAPPEAKPGGGPVFSPTPSSFVGQVPLLGGLMIAQAVIEFAFGLFFVAMAFVVPAILATDPNFKKASGPISMVNFLFGTYLVMGATAVAVGLLRCASGILVTRYRSRGLAIAANSLGLLAMVTVYCAPTAIALGIYGLIVLLNPAVAQAFAARKYQTGKS